MPQFAPEGVHILPGDPDVEVTVRRSRRAKRFSLRVSRSDGRVSLSLPLWAPDHEALAFLQEREVWLRRQIANAPAAQRAQIGAILPVMGLDRRIVAGSGRSARLSDTEIQVPLGPRQGPRIRALLTELARAQLADAVARHARRLGRTPGKLTLRDPRSRWGSCSTEGNLMFSWRLILAPPAVLDYVAAHEVAHLEEMNHAAAFWTICRQLCPETDTHRAWLRQHGTGLLAWRFDLIPPQD